MYIGTMIPWLVWALQVHVAFEAVSWSHASLYNFFPLFRIFRKMKQKKM
jgi:hypothetical protein